MKFPQSSFVFTVLVVVAHQANAALDFVDTITRSTGTTPLNFTGLQFDKPFTIGWVDGASAVNISVWMGNANTSSTFLETVESNLAESGAIDWTPTLATFSPSATMYPPRNSNIIAPRSESSSNKTTSLMPNVAYRLTVNDNTTTVFSPSFTIANVSSKKNGKSKMTIIGIVVACAVTMLIAAGVVAFILYRKKSNGQARRRERLKQKIHINGSTPPLFE